MCYRACPDSDGNNDPWSVAWVGGSEDRRLTTDDESGGVSLDEVEEILQWVEGMV